MISLSLLASYSTLQVTVPLWFLPEVRPVLITVRLRNLCATTLRIKRVTLVYLIRTTRDRPCLLMDVTRNGTIRSVPADQLRV
jgi:uncharacterized membrane protein YjdF